jgi:hypothetical protein
MALPYHLRVAFLQFVPMCLKALKNKDADFTAQTWVSIYQKDVAQRLGVTQDTVLNRETEQTWTF